MIEKIGCNNVAQERLNAIKKIVREHRRIRRNGAAKKLIAAKAAAPVLPGPSVYVDAGSTCLESGKALLGRKDIRLVTHSLALPGSLVDCRVAALLAMTERKRPCQNEYTLL